VYVTILAAAPLLIAAGRWALAVHGGGRGSSGSGIASSAAAPTLPPRHSGVIEL
jgi:hypothetical protein